VLRNQKLSAYFISNQGSLFYQSDRFSRILRYLQENPAFGRMREDRDKLTLSVRNVGSIAAAADSLEKLLS